MSEKIIAAKLTRPLSLKNGHAIRQAFKIGPQTIALSDYLASFDGSPHRAKVWEAYHTLEAEAQNPSPELRKSAERSGLDLREWCALETLISLRSFLHSHGIRSAKMDPAVEKLREQQRRDAAQAHAIAAQAEQTRAIASATTAPADDAAGSLPASLGPNLQYVLCTLNKLDPAALASIPQICEQMDELNAISVRTIGPAVQKLITLGLAERPDGRNHGARLTKNGRAQAAKIVPTIAAKIAD